jgi:hypothetical protein
MNSTVATACTASPASSTGRRPVWSDSLLNVSRAASTASAYTPNATVVVSGENPHCAAYSAYIGVGAADMARNETLFLVDDGAAPSMGTERMGTERGATG